jgi:hypothetical protein
LLLLLMPFPLLSLQREGRQLSSTGSTSKVSRREESRPSTPI